MLQKPLLIDNLLSCFCRIEKTNSKMDWMLDRVARMSSEEIVWYLTMGMIGNGLFVAPILTYVIPAYYGNGWS